MQRDFIQFTKTQFTISNLGIFNIDIDYEQPVFLLQIDYILSLPVGQAVAKYQF